MMITSSNRETAMNSPSIPHDPSPTWKLYHNPFFISNSHHCSSHHHHHKSACLQRSHSASTATTFWDLSLFKMEESQSQSIMELMAELDYERRLRKKAESLNKRLAREAAEERSGKEALERVCENLATKVSADAAEMDRMRREMEEERKMLRMAEVFREERVQMKLSDARIVWEEKLSEVLGGDNKGIYEENWGFGLGGKEETEEGKGNDGPTSEAVAVDSQAAGELPAKCRKLVIGGDKWWWDEGSRDRGVAGDGGGGGNGAVENPHIRRGIKGFVEFRRVVRSNNNVGSSKSSSSSRHWGTKLECQKAQLRILLKQRSPIRSSNNALIIS